MSYKPRDERPGFHHVVTRGNNKRRIFHNDADRQAFMRILALVAYRHGWTIYAYCLMPDHLHLLMRPTNSRWSVGDIVTSMKRFTTKKT